MTPHEFDEPISGKASFVPRAPAGSMTRLIGGLASMFAGFGILLGGLILHFAEKADKVTILPIPIAGRLTAVVGLGIVGLGAWLARRRAAMAFSVLVVVGGLILYAFGLAYVEQLGNRICQALGLLTSLVGLMAIWLTHDIGRAIQTEGTTKPEKRSSPDLD
jgi:hypothetical protein